MDKEENWKIDLNGIDLKKIDVRALARGGAKENMEELMELRKDVRCSGTASRSIGIYRIEKKPLFEAAAAQSGAEIEFGPPNLYFDAENHFDLRSSEANLEEFWEEVRRMEFEGSGAIPGRSVWKGSVTSGIEGDSR